MRHRDVRVTEERWTEGKEKQVSQVTPMVESQGPNAGLLNSWLQSFVPSTRLRSPLSPHDVTFTNSPRSRVSQRFSRNGGKKPINHDEGPSVPISPSPAGFLNQRGFGSRSIRERSSEDGREASSGRVQAKEAPYRAAAGTGQPLKQRLKPQMSTGPRLRKPAL